MKGLRNTLVVSIMLCSILLSGCSVNLISIANDAIAVTKAVLAADPNIPDAADLQAAIAAMQLAINGWNGSSLNCELQSAASIAADIINADFANSTAALIATVAVAGLDVLLENLPSACSTLVSHRLMARLHRKDYAVPGLRATQAYANYHTALKGAYKWRLSHDFESSFNKAAKTSGLSINLNQYKSK